MISLLRDIQSGSTDHAVPLSDVLRKCLILAQRLQLDALKSWATNELNGYTEPNELPDYRAKRYVHTRGDFMNIAWHLKGSLIPPLAVDEPHRDLLFSVEYTEGVAHFESLLRSDQDQFAVPWPADFVAYYQTRLMDGAVLREARRIISRAEIEALLDQIRNRVLAFALEIEKESPDAGEADVSGNPPVAFEKSNQIFDRTINISGGLNFVASGSHSTIRDVSIGERGIIPGQWETLEAALTNIGVPQGDLAKLKIALDEDALDEGAAAPGRAVKGWLGDVVAKVATGSVLLANNAAGSAIATFVMAYFGLVPSSAG